MYDYRYVFRPKCDEECVCETIIPYLYLSRKENKL